MRKLTYIFIAFGLVACTRSERQSESTVDEPITMNTPIEERFFGTTETGDTVTLYTLINSNGLTMEVIDYGGIIVSLKVPDRQGKLGDIVLGFDSLQPYLQGHPFFGALVGRYGNRIANGKFILDGQEYDLVQNNGVNHLHGGTKGFDKVIWETKAKDTPQGPMLEMSYVSAHLEEGYPGELSVRVTYLLNHQNQLKVDYQADTDRPTVVNLTQHSYFNLNPEAETILAHELLLNADHYLPVDEGLIPLGTLENVEGTPFDFLAAHTIGDRIDEDHLQIARGGGYDHCWVLNGPSGEMKLAAVVFDVATGREMVVETTEPGVQFYTSNFLDGSLKGKGKAYLKRGGLCLETQHYPDSPNRREFPSTRLDPGETYQTTTVFNFAVR